MAISKNFIFKEVAGDYMIIPILSNNVDMSKIFNINEVGAFIYKALLNTDDLESIADGLTKEYEVSFEVALKDTKEFVEALRVRGIYE